MGRALLRWIRWQLNKRIFRRVQRVTLYGGSVLVLPSNSHFATEIYVTNGNVDWGSERLLMASLDPDGAFLDVGAHIGYYAVMATAFVAEVWAFEPDPRILPQLKAVASPVISVVESAVGSVTGTRGFALDAEPALSHFSDTGIEVPVVAIDEFVGANLSRRVTGIKIDVEGWDLEVLEGARKIIQRDQPLVLTEFNQSATNDQSQLLVFCESLGYWPLALVRPAVGQGNPREKRLARLPVGSSWRYKMVFLVPDRLHGVRTFQIDAE